MVTHGGGETAFDAIEALIENTDAPFEFIVVDNASPDGTAALLEERLVGARIVANEDNVGFAPGVEPGRRARLGPLPLLPQPGRLRPAGLVAAASGALRARRIGRSRGAALPAPGRPCSGSRLGRGLERRRALDRRRRRSERVRASVPSHDRLRLRGLPARTRRPLPRSRRIRPGLHARVLRGRRPLLQAPGARLLDRLRARVHA